jgi:8-oxo-dGTP diphosphatase
VFAAGALVWRDSGSGPQVLVIHRPKYDDWSLPKGKLDPGEHAVSAAVREVEEETGVRVRLGPPLRSRRYRLADGALKEVRFWLAHPLDDTDTPAYEANAEVDEVEWLPIDRAAHRLSSGQDVELLAALDKSARMSVPLVVLRHAKALARKAWDGEDLRRPLSVEGEAQARRLPALLGAYGIELTVSSDAVRCLDTVRPFLDATKIELADEHNLSEEAEKPAAVRELVAELLNDSTPTVICTHRKVLPDVFAAIGTDDPRLEPAGLVVVHRRAGTVTATERHAP